MDAEQVPQSAITDAAETIAEKIDILLDRATDAVLRAPRPGSAQWHRKWQDRETVAGRAALEQHANIKSAIATLAGVDLHHDNTPATSPPGPSMAEGSAGTNRRRGRSTQTKSKDAFRRDCGQLAIW